MKAYVATVHLVITGCETVSEAQDAVTACLTENLEAAGAIKDWAYARRGTKVEEQGIRGIDLPAKYEEGDFLRLLR